MSSRPRDEAVFHETALPEDMVTGEVPRAERAKQTDDATVAPAAPRSRWGLVASIVLAVLVAAAVVVGTVLGMHGYRAFVMETPSMGTSAPVGSLVVVQPSSVAQLHQGDVVTVAPREGGTTHTHRVVEVSGAGAVTRGDLNGSPDPERVGDDNLVGRAVAILPAMGWVVKMLPIVLVTLLLTFLLTVRVQDRHARFRYRALGFFCGVALAIVLVKPLLGVQLLSMRLDQNEDGPYAVANVVSTGIFPVQVAPSEDQGQASQLLAPTGTAGQAVSTLVSKKGEFAFYPSLALTPLWWLGMIAYCASPFLLFGLHAWVTREKRTTTP